MGSGLESKHCYSCGARLWKDSHCFICNAGRTTPPSRVEAAGLTYHELLEVIGKEEGFVQDIIVRIQSRCTPADAAGEYAEKTLYQYRRRR